MKRMVSAALCAFLLLASAPSEAHAEKSSPDTGISAQAEKEWVKEKIAKADRAKIKADKGASAGGVSVTASYGSYPRRKGVIMVTPDKAFGIFATGHAAIIYSYYSVVESNPSPGVAFGDNNWYATRSQAYGVTPYSTTSTQDAYAASWSSWQVGKGYNWNFYDVNTRARFYCSHLVWASFRDNFGLNLDTGSWGAAIHPMELVNNSRVYLIYRKA